MKTKAVVFYSLCLLLIARLNTAALDKRQQLNIPPKREVQALVNQAVSLAEADKPWAAIAAIRKALSISPDYLRAHIEYRNIKVNFLGRYDEVENEYNNLIRQHPNNPVYLMAVYYHSNGEFGREFLQRIVELAPEWTWAHYARALLIKKDDPEGAAIELKRCIEGDSSALAAYNLLIDLQEKRLHKIDDAIRTAERLAAQTDIRPSLRLLQLWRLGLVKAQQPDDAKLALRNKLEQIAKSTNQIDVLSAVRQAYADLLDDSQSAELIANRIRRIDTTWTPDRGWIFTQIHTNQSGVPRYVVLVNRQLTVNRRVKEITDSISAVPEQKMRQLEALLAFAPSLPMRRRIYEEIFRVAVISRNATTARRYGSRLYDIDPDDSALLSQLALVFADNRSHLAQARYLAAKAEKLTFEFRRAKRPLNTSQSFFDEIFPVEEQRKQYEKNRALALEALGWVLVQLGNVQKGETYLRQALAIGRTEHRLERLSVALERLGRTREAAIVRAEESALLAASIRRNLISEKLIDLQFQPMAGLGFKLSDLSGKVVLINFWATWCSPCMLELPILERLYAQYKDRGFEVLAISTDEDLYKVQTFVSRNKLSFPVISQPALKKTFGIEEVPVSLFVDKQGTLRYRKLGFEYGDEREIEFVIMELLR